MRVDGIDLAADVIEASRAVLHAAGFADRATLHVGDVRDFVSRTAGRPYQLVTLFNNVYYFPKSGA